MRLPLVGRWLNRLRLRRPFDLERRLLRGAPVRTSDQPSVFHFSIHKSATQYVKSILARCAAENRLLHAQLNEYLATQPGTRYLDHLTAEEMRRYQHAFRSRGFLYSSFAGMLEGVPDLARCRRVLMLRDPRDALTSEYYSIAFSHQLPEAADKRAELLGRRQHAQRSGVDAYVLSASERLLRTCQRYMDLLLPQPGVYLTTYERMIADFPAWLDSLLAACGFEISPDLRRCLLAEAYSSRPQRENIHSHLRQVTPGDHRRKLQPETIARLDDLFADVLRRFGYR